MPSACWGGACGIAWTDGANTKPSARAIHFFIGCLPSVAGNQKSSTRRGEHFDVDQRWCGSDAVVGTTWICRSGLRSCTGSRCFLNESQSFKSPLDGYEIKSLGPDGRAADRLGSQAHEKGDEGGLWEHGAPPGISSTMGWRGRAMTLTSCRDHSEAKHHSEATRHIIVTRP